MATKTIVNLDNIFHNAESTRLGQRTKYYMRHAEIMFI